MACMAVYTIPTSRQLRVGFLLAFGLATLAVMLADLHIVLRMLLIGMLIGYLSYAWPRQAVIRLRTTDTCVLDVWHEGDWHQARILAHTVVLPAITVLVMQAESDAPRKYVTILGDNLNVDEHRRLRVWLRRHAPDRNSVEPA